MSSSAAVSSSMGKPPSSRMSRIPAPPRSSVVSTRPPGASTKPPPPSSALSNTTSTTSTTVSLAASSSAIQSVGIPQVASTVNSSSSNFHAPPHANANKRRAVEMSGSTVAMTPRTEPNHNDEISSLRSSNIELKAMIGVKEKELEKARAEISTLLQQIHQLNDQWKGKMAASEATFQQRLQSTVSSAKDSQGALQKEIHEMKMQREIRDRTLQSRGIDPVSLERFPDVQRDQALQVANTLEFQMKEIRGKTAKLINSFSQDIEYHRALRQQLVQQQPPQQCNQILNSQQSQQFPTPSATTKSESVATNLNYSAMLGFDSSCILSPLTEEMEKENMDISHIL